MGGRLPLNFRSSNSHQTSIERKLEGRNDHEAEAIRGYCLAVRTAITDDGRPPLAASGLKLHERIEAIHGSVQRVSKKGNFPEGFPGS
jgi:hypothetical protein